MNVSENRAEVVADGRVTPGMVIEQMVTVAGDADFNPEMDVLVDYRAADFNPTLADGLEIAATFRRLHDLFHRRVAVVVKGGVTYQVVRVACSLPSGGKAVAKAFRDIQRADRWLKERR